MKKTVFAILMVFVLFVTGCGKDKYNTHPVKSPGNQQGNTDNSDNSGNPSEGVVIDTSGLFSDRDHQSGYDVSTGVTIELKGNTIVSNSEKVTVSGSTVTIKDEGTYILSGTLADGMVIIDAEKTDKLQLVLNNVSINKATSAALYVKQADKVFVTMADKSVNSLVNGGKYAAFDESNIDAVIFSKDDITFNGTGTLKISSPSGHGIVSKDELTITGGSYEITASLHGITGNDNVCIAGGTFNITSGKDGIHADNAEDASLGFVYIQKGTFNISSTGDGISASSQLMIDEGSFKIVTGGGSTNAKGKSNQPGGGRGPFGGSSGNDTKDNGVSAKAVKAKGDITIKGGSFTIDALDDAVSSGSNANISGGNFEIATGDDGFHAENTLSISSANINIKKSYEGLEGHHVKINSGKIRLYATDDGINAAGGTGEGGAKEPGKGGFGGWCGGTSDGSIEITGGDLYVNAGGDGIDANGTLKITGGYIVVCGPTVGDTATLDFDVSGVITGGTFIGTGAAGMMAQTFSDSELGVIAVKVGNQVAGTAISLKDSEGNMIIPPYQPELNYAIVIISSPEMVKGKTYTITVGSTSSEIKAS